MEEQILTLSKSSDISLLKSYVQSLEINYICSEVSKICTREDGEVVLQALLGGLSNSFSCQEKRVKISATILSDVERKLISQKAASKLMSVLSAQVDFLTTPHVMKLIEICLQMIQGSNPGDGSSCWKEFLPKLLNVMIEKEEVEHNGSMMTGWEYKSEIVTAICVNDWSDSTVTNIASMFIEMPLSKAEHLRIVNKLCRYLQKMQPDEVPPLTHQILQLTKIQHSTPLFISLEEYFDANLYKKLGQNLSLSQLPPKEAAKLKELQIVEGTVLYHIYTAASILGPQSIKDFLKILKETSNFPDFTLKPFFVTLLLTVSCISHTFEEEVTNLLKSAILRTIAEEEKLKESAWLESVIAVPCDVDQILDKIIDNCFRERDRVLKGLVSLSFSLLGVSKVRGKESQCERMWSIGITVLTKLVKKYNDVTNSVLKTLGNHIAQVHESTQYTDCLLRIVRKSPLNVLDCSSVLIQFLDNICARLPGDIGQRVVAAMLPLTRMSHSLRDNLIIVLRKSLFPHEPTCREMAVSGFLELLKYLKISDIRSLSQTTTQNYYGFTQIYSETCTGPEPTNSNEGMCLEILSILKQVFKHQHRVKIVFYAGVYDSVCANPELGSHVLYSLQTQFDQFYKAEDAIPPLDFEKTVAVQGAQVVVQEPLAHLLIAISLIVASLDPEGTKSGKQREMLDSLCERMSDSDVPHFGLEMEDGTSLLDPERPECLMKQEQLRQILGVYESLMGYTLCTWTKDTPDKGRILFSLFKGFSRLSDFAKGLTKLDQEKGKNKKKDGAKEKKKDKPKPVAFKFAPTVLNLKCASCLLSLLNEPSLTWATEQSAVAVKGKRELHRYSMQVTLSLIKQAQLSPSSELSQNTFTLSYLCKIGKLLYTRCVMRLSEMKEFDLFTTVSALECFSELISLVLTHFKSKFSSFLSYISEVLVEKGIRVQVKTIVDVLLEQLDEVLKDGDEDEDSKEDELHTRKVSFLLVSITSTMVNQLPRGGSQAPKVLDKIKEICKERKVESLNVAKALLSLLMSMYIKCKCSGGLMLDLALCLCSNMKLIDGDMEIEDHVDYAVINATSANVCLSSMCESLRTLCYQIEWAVSRFKAELVTLSFPTEEPLEVRRENLSERERELCRHINFVVKVLSTLCTIAVPPGVFADAVLKEIGNVYNKLGLVAKYFIVKVGKYQQPLQSTRFEKTVKLVDHELSKNMYCFTEHVIADGAGSSDAKQNKKDPTMLKNKFLKETKIIPKVVFEKEQFNKFLLLLSNKSKVDLVGQTKFTMARDYRLYTKQMKEILEKENVQEDENLMDVDSSTQEETQSSESSQPSKKQRTLES